MNKRESILKIAAIPIRELNGIAWVYKTPIETTYFDFNIPNPNPGEIRMSVPKGFIMVSR